MPPEEAWPRVGDYSCAFRMPASSFLSSCPSFPARLASCLLTSLPLPKGAAHPPREAPWDGADGGGSGCPIRSTAWPGLEKWLGRAWSLSPNFAPAGLWVSFPGLPACCLPSFPFCLRPGALFSCFPWTGPVEWPPGRRPPPLGLADTALLARLLDGHALRCSAGSEWEGALCPGWPVPPTPHRSLPRPQSHPWPWLQLISQLWSQPHRALQGVIWLPLVSERIIFSVDCPFL